MGRITLIITFLLLTFNGMAQFRNKEIIRYDFDTYKGPIKKGWLFSDAEYKKLYRSYHAMDSLNTYFDKQVELLRVINQFKVSVDSLQSEKLMEKDRLIGSQEQIIKDLNANVKSAVSDNQKILGQFWKVGGIRLHKGTSIAFIGLFTGIVLIVR